MMQEMLKRNLGYKIVSLVLALLFWLWVTTQGSSQGLYGDQNLTVALVLRNQPSNIIVMTKLPAIHFRLQGNNPNVNVKDLFAYVDLSGATPGEHSFVIQMDPPPQMKILDLQPQNLALQLDSVQEKTLPVQVNLTGTPADGFQASDPVVRPQVVNVRGPGTILNVLDKAIVEVSLTGANATVQTSLPVLFRDKNGHPVYGPDASVNVLTASPNMVDVIVAIQPKGLASKDIPIRVKTAGTPAKGMVLKAITPAPPSVLVFGTAAALKGFDALNLGPVDISDLSENKVFPISSDKVSLPTGISFAVPTTFNIVAQIGPGPVEKTISGLPVTVKNLSPGVDQDQPIPPIAVTIRGLPGALNTVTPDQIQLWVDASGLAPGSYPNSRVYYQLPPNVEMVIQPEVTLSLKAHQTQ